jgi:sterol desaturase/sphingolipid hydroxylase (fatty acid hydroxylase superfamily)
MSLVLFLFGHALSSLLVYLNHRFVLHGKLGKLPLLKDFRQLHIAHHRHAYDDERNLHFEPLWLTGSLFFIIGGIGVLVNGYLALGMASFAGLYAYRHKRIHNKDESSYFSKHHRYHHTRNGRVNFSGIYPWIDKLFGTFVDSSCL